MNISFGSFEQIIQFWVQVLKLTVSAFVLITAFKHDKIYMALLILPTKTYFSTQSEIKHN